MCINSHLPRRSGLKLYKKYFEFYSIPSFLWVLYIRTFKSIAREHIISIDKSALAPNFYYSLATVCYVLTKNFSFWKHGILLSYAFVC